MSDKTFWSISRFGWDASALLLLSAVALGFACSWFTFNVKDAPDPAFAIAMTPFVVLCEEIFFRGFLLRLLDYFFKNDFETIFFGALLYSLYFMTFYFVTEQTWSQQLYRVGLSYVSLSLPLTIFYWRTKSLSATCFCHGTVNIAVLMRAL